MAETEKTYVADAPVTGGKIIFVFRYSEDYENQPNQIARNTMQGKAVCPGK